MTHIWRDDPGRIVRVARKEAHQLKRKQGLGPHPWTMERFWREAEHFRYLRLKGGLYVINNGKVG